MNSKTVNLQSKLFRVFIGQALLISAAAIAGVYATAFVVENVLVRAALEGEADHFWEMHGKDPEFPTPNTQNLRGYLRSDLHHGVVPEELHDMNPGFGRHHLHGSAPIVHVSDHKDERLYLVFDEEQVSQLAFYFGIAPLSAVLLAIYLLMWLAFRQSSKAISPLVQLADQVAEIDPLKSDLHALKFETPETTNTEVLVLINALDQFTQRLQSFLDRERAFTRDASHELRTPLAVIRGNAELMLVSPDLNDEDRTAVHRIMATAHDMRELTETLLMLAHEEKDDIPQEDVIVNDLLEDLVGRLAPLLKESENNVEVEAKVLLQLRAPIQVVNILFTNLLRNAINHTRSGTITVLVHDQMVTVSDTGHGIDEESLKRIFEPFYRAENADEMDTQGHGLGLSIVRRLCARYGWDVKATSAVGKGTSVSILFPDSTVIGRKGES